MVRSGSLIIVHLVEPRQAGYRFERTRTTWPLHITLVPWFAASSEEEIIKDLQDLAANQSAFTAEVGEDTTLGARKDIPVNLIANPEPIKKLQKLLIEAARRHDAVFADERFVGDNSRPHITQHSENRRFEGDRQEVRDFTLVHLLPQNMCEVVQNFGLQADNEAAA